MRFFQGMHFYRFIFLARNWASDRLPLAKHLTFMAERASRHSASSLPSKLLLLIFPEGTLVSKDTRPQSKRYAGKMGFNDLENLLLPRSTGLLFCLRTLASQIDDLELLVSGERIWLNNLPASCSCHLHLF